MPIAIVLATVVTAPASSGDRDAAQAHVRRATEHFSGARYADAVVELKQAYRLVPISDHFYNIARCYEEMGRPRPAVGYFERYLASGADPVKVERSREALNRLGRRVYGRLVIQCDAPGARVTVGDLEEGPCPFERAEIKAGRYLVKVTAAGRRDVEVEVRVRAQRSTSRKISLPDAPGLLTVRSVPDGAEVIVGGRSVGHTPLEGLQLDAGVHEVQVRKRGWTSWSANVQLQAGQSTRLAPELERSGGRLDVTSAPSPAEVLLDGSSVGMTPLRGLFVPSGEHVVEVDAPWHAGWRRDVKMASDEELSIHAEPASRAGAWLFASGAIVAAVAAGAAWQGALGGYQQRDKLKAEYDASIDDSDAASLAGQVRSVEQQSTQLMLTGRALAGLSLVLAGGMAWSLTW